MRRRPLIGALGSLMAAGGMPLVVHADALLRGPSRQRRSGVLIVGSGPAGLALADALASAGVAVTLVESGHYRRSEQQALARVLGAGETPLPFDPAFASQRVVGGSTVYWAGYSPRFREADLDPSAGWPIGLSVLDEHYCAAEQWLGVKGAGGCTHPWQDPVGARAARLSEALEGIGLSGAVATPVASTSAAGHSPLRLGRHVAPRLGRKANIRIVTGATVRRVMVDARGQAGGVRVVSDGDREFELAADTVVLACGAIQNARLLLLGTGRRSPHGLGNHTGLVGRRFMEHPHVRGWLDADSGRLPAMVAEPGQVHCDSWHGIARKAGHGGLLARVEAFPEVPDHAFTAAAPAGRLLFDVLCEQRPSAENGIALSGSARDRFGDPLPELRFTLSDRDQATLAFARQRIRAVADRLDADLQMEPVAYGSHLMGTTRMGTQPASSVVDANQQVHGVPGLFVAGASVFPSGGAANPTLTLTALSLRLARHLSRR